MSSKSIYSPSFFDTGPFASASLNIDNISCNLYFSYLLEQSLSQHLESQKKFEKALASNDEKLIEESKNNLDYLEGIFSLALSLTNYEELES